MSKKHCYYIPESGYDVLNDHEGRWKYSPDEEMSFEQYYPRGWNGCDCKPPDDNEFEISADFEAGGWIIHGNLELFAKWVESTGRNEECIMDEPPEPEDMEDCYG
jgi:hypothetical protein